MIGNSIDTGTNNNPNLKEPPIIAGKDERYDSVKGHTNGSDIYIVYDNVKTYPNLLVSYMI
jgi:hypothetical protein